MSSPLTSSLVTVGLAILAKIDSAKTAVIAPLTAPLGHQYSAYGDQEILPAYPAVCVEPGPKNKQYQGATRNTLVEFTLYVVCYLGKVQSVQTQAIQIDQFAENVEKLLDADPTLGPVGTPQQLLIDLLVTNLEPGYAQKRDSIIRANRLTVSGKSRVILPNAS